MTRSLVTARRITALNPIPGADRIELASIDGWNCVVKKNEFQVGDRAVYFEIDSLLPASDERFAFLVGKDGADVRVKTAKIRGATSQGLLMPLDAFPEVRGLMDWATKGMDAENAEGQIRLLRFEEELGVRKWERPETTATSGPAGAAEFPCFIQKTDQERVQNLPGIFSRCRDDVYQETTKMDGSSMTVYFLRNDSKYCEFLPELDEDSTSLSSTVFPDGRVGVCSRNRDISETAPNSGHFWPVALANNLPKKLSMFGRSIALQGELCGSSIQSNFEGFPPGTHDFFLFSVWDIDKQNYIPPREVHEMWAPMLGIRHVPVVGYRTLGEMGSSLADLLARADGTGINGRKREGIVLKHVDGGFNTFKIISNSYLLKHGE